MCLRISAHERSRLWMRTFPVSGADVPAVPVRTSAGEVHGRPRRKLRTSAFLSAAHKVFREYEDGFFQSVPQSLSGCEPDVQIFDTGDGNTLSGVAAFSVTRKMKG
jgi:hypothetical protein